MAKFHNMEINGERAKSGRRTSAPPAAEPRPTGTQSIERVVRILRFLSAQPRAGVRLNHIAAEVDLEISTAHRMLKCLVAEKMLGFDPSTRQYALGPLVFELGLAAVPSFDIRGLCQPSIARLAQQTGDTIIVTARSDLDGVCVARQEGPYPIKTFTVDIGNRRPLGVGAGSLAILSALPDEEIATVLTGNASRLGKYEGLTPAKMLAWVRDCRRTGYAVRDVPIVEVPDVRALGVAVLDPSGRPVAALSVVTIARRLPKSRQREVQALLGHEAETIRAAMRHL
jgi:DNA-binding IclR family transcriptional regulator